jgi:acyl-CoA synthetase (AMP-forming)/AMP-acid ligase II
VLLLSQQYLARGEHPLRHATFFGYGHVAGQVPSMITLFTGGTLFVHEGISFERIIRQIEVERVNSMLLFPALLYMLLDHPLLAETDTSSLRTVSCSGAPTAPARMAQAIARFGAAMRPTYGMTEVPFITALPNLTVDPDRPDRLGSCGYPYGDIRIEIRDGLGRVRPTREIGDVWVTGGLVMAGYWGQPELTRETIVDGWCRTGDIGYVDEDGYLFLVDRQKDMIITGYGATNVYCRPIEDILAAHPGVRAAAVIGVPDEAFGEVAYAYVVTQDGATVTADDLQRRVLDEFDERWAPRGVEFVDSLPLTDIGKVDKKALRARHWTPPAPDQPATG